MSFRVEPNSLDEFSRSLNSLADDARKAGQYVETHTKEADEKNGWLLSWLYSLGVLRIGAAAEANALRLERLTRASARELARSAEAYRRSERRNIERLDMIYPR